MRYLFVFVVALLGCNENPKTQTVVEMTANPWAKTEEHLKYDQDLQQTQNSLLQETNRKLDELTNAVKGVKEPGPVAMEIFEPFTEITIHDDSRESELIEPPASAEPEVVTIGDEVPEPVEDSKPETEAISPDELLEKLQQGQAALTDALAAVVDRLDDLTAMNATEEGEVSAETQEPFRPEQQANGNEWTVRHFRATYFSQTTCDPCKVWKLREQPDIVCPTREWNISTDGNYSVWVRDKKGKIQQGQINTTPSIVLDRIKSDGSWQQVQFFSGYTAADVINNAVQVEIERLNNANQANPGVIPSEPVASVEASDCPVVTEWSVDFFRRLEVKDAPAEIMNALRSGRTVWLDRTKTPAVQLQVFPGGRIDTYPVGYNMAANKHLSRTGSPNNEAPWLHSGGFDNVDAKIMAAYFLPGKVRIKREEFDAPAFRKEADSLSAARLVGEYPVGTVAAEFVVTDNLVRCLRYRHKEQASGWCEAQIDFGPMPDGYREVANCTDCHRDITKHANEIDASQEWYTTVRGLEPGGPFNFPFYRITGSGMDGKGEFNPEVAHLIEVVR